MYTNRTARSTNGANSGGGAEGAGGAGEAGRAGRAGGASWRQRQLELLLRPSVSFTPISSISANSSQGNLLVISGARLIIRLVRTKNMLMEGEKNRLDLCLKEFHIFMSDSCLSS